MWLLDVDGVLNAARPGWGEAADQGPAFVGGIAYTLRWAPPLIQRIGSVLRSGAVEGRWATTWVDNIMQVERLLRLPPMQTAFRDLECPEDARRTSELKLCAAFNVVEHERRPLIWTDDDAIPLGGPDRERLLAAGVPVLLLAPGSAHGLQPEDLADIDDFLATITEMAS